MADEGGDGPCDGVDEGVVDGGWQHHQHHTDTSCRNSAPIDLPIRPQ